MRGSVGLARGIYSVPEVARLAALRAERVHRWTRSPLIPPSWPKSDGRTTLDFCDLVEVLFVRAFLAHGVTMSQVRAAAKAAALEFETSHPFCLKRFETDGKTIMVRLENGGETRLIDLVGGQSKLTEVVMPLLKRLDYDVTTDLAVAWWPMGKAGMVVVDPARSFGAPILVDSGIQTRVLAGPVAAGDSVDEVAEWFTVPATAVRAAVKFEESLAARPMAA